MIPLKKKLFKRLRQQHLFLGIDDTLISKSKNTKHIQGLTKLSSHVTGKYEMAHCQVSLQGE